MADWLFSQLNCDMHSHTFGNHHVGKSMRFGNKKADHWRQSCNYGIEAPHIELDKPYKWLTSYGESSSDSRCQEEPVQTPSTQIVEDRSRLFEAAGILSYEIETWYIETSIVITDIGQPMCFLGITSMCESAWHDQVQICNTHQAIVDNTRGILGIPRSMHQTPTTPRSWPDRTSSDVPFVQAQADGSSPVCGTQ
jgi:hypothetical protein